MSGILNEERSPIPVPLPTEVPPPPDLSSLPPHILHSGTVETLIGQNEDLMSRLKVNIRRNSILEQQLLENERINSELTHVNNSLMSQLQILQEKERLMREKSSRIDSHQDGLRAEIEMLAVRLRAAEERREQLSMSLKREQRFSRRVRSWVRPLVNRLRVNLDQATSRLATREAQVSDLRARLDESTVYAQNLEKQYNRDQARLVAQYEERQKSLEADLKVLSEKAQHVVEAIACKAEADNRIVYLERQNEEMERCFKNELFELQNQLGKYRQEAKILAVETLEYDRRLNEATQELNSLRQSYSHLQDQFESLQTVWADSQKRLDAARLQQESLNALNQELSRQLKNVRKLQENSTLESPSSVGTETTPSTGSTAALNSENKKDLKTLDERFNKIENLLVELESGMAVTRPGVTAPLKNLEIEESDVAQGPEIKTDPA